MNINHEKVSHCLFGAGTITSQTATTVTVDFCEKFGTKKFLYPSAFESFLKLCDPKAKAEMDGELEQIRLQAEKERRNRIEEEEQHREVERLALLEQKRVTVKKRSSAKRPAAKSPKRVSGAKPAEEGIL